MHCKMAQLRILNGMQRKKLGRQTGRGPSMMEQTPSPSWNRGKGWEQKKLKEKVLKMGCVVDLLSSEMGN